MARQAAPCWGPRPLHAFAVPGHAKPARNAQKPVVLFDVMDTLGKSGGRRPAGSCAAAVLSRLGRRPGSMPLVDRGVCPGATAFPAPTDFGCAWADPAPDAPTLHSQHPSSPTPIDASGACTHAVKDPFYDHMPAFFGMSFQEVGPHGASTVHAWVAAARRGGPSVRRRAGRRGNPPAAEQAPAPSRPHPHEAAPPAAVRSCWRPNTRQLGSSLSWGTSTRRSLRPVSGGLDLAAAPWTVSLSGGTW